MTRPDIVIGKAAHDRLTRIANSLLDSRTELAEELLGELDRARLAEDEAIPAGTVQMDSAVTYHMDDGQERRVTLVYPADADIAQGKVSILTPIGTALLGLSAGQTIDFAGNDGRRHLLTVLSVDAPEHAAG